VELASVLSYALVQPVGPEDDGVVGEQNEDQEHVADPARPPLTVARAREMTAGLRVDGQTIPHDLHDQRQAIPHPRGHDSPPGR
jgi:hypothetical protein